MNLVSNSRMEAELTDWLQGFESAGTPIALRLRTFGDLRAEADRPRRPLPWLMPAMSSVASLGAVVLGAGLVLLLAVVGAALDHGVGGPGYGVGAGFSSQMGPPAIAGSALVYTFDPVALFVLLVASGLVGAVFANRRAWDIAARLALGRAEPPSVAAHRPLNRSWTRIPLRAWDAATTGTNSAMGKGGSALVAPLPIRQPWRSVPRLTWALATLSVVTAAIAIEPILTSGMGLTVPEYAVGLYATTVSASLVVAYVWRYPSQYRAGRLLAVGAVTAVVGNLILGILGNLVRWEPVSFNGLVPGLLELSSTLAMVSIVAVAAGLAARSGNLSRPPVLTATVSIGASFFVAMYSLEFTNLNLWEMPLDQLQSMALGSASRWIDIVGFLAVLWIGLSTSRRRGGSWAWRLVFAYGALTLLSQVPNYLLFYGQLIGVWGPDWGTARMMMWSSTVAGSLASTALLVALLSGLRPPSADSVAPAPPGEAEADAADVTEEGAPI